VHVLSTGANNAAAKAAVMNFRDDYDLLSDLKRPFNLLAFVGVLDAKCVPGSRDHALSLDEIG
jgi:hypothetical protein